MSKFVWTTNSYLDIANSRQIVCSYVLRIYIIIVVPDRAKSNPIAALIPQNFYSLCLFRHKKEKDYSMSSNDHTKKTISPHDEKYILYSICLVENCDLGEVLPIAII